MREVLVGGQMLSSKASFGWMSSLTVRSPISKSRGTYHRKLLKPKTRMVTPVNCTTLAKSLSNSSTSSRNIGAMAKGPKPCTNVTRVADAVVEAFQKVLQFFQMIVNICL